MALIQKMTLKEIITERYTTFPMVLSRFVFFSGSTFFVFLSFLTLTGGHVDHCNSLSSSSD